MKLSDALRGAADRAPVSEVQVSAARATGRIKRERALRLGANGLVGAGVVAVVAFAAIGPAGGVPGAGLEAATMESDMPSEDIATDDGAMPDMAGAMDETEESAENFSGAAGQTRLADPWMCGSDFDGHDGSWAWGDASGVTFTAGAPEWDDDDVFLPHVLEAHRAVDLISPSPDHVVTWNGIVVGQSIDRGVIEYGPADEPLLPEGQVYERLEPGTDTESLEQSTQLELVNCWDGEPFPAGEYQVHQAWTLAYAGQSATSAELTDDELPDGPLETFRVAVDPVPLTIDGDQVDDPFAAYLAGDGPVIDEPVSPLPQSPKPLPEPVEPPQLPTEPLPTQPLPTEPMAHGVLTPQLARQLFEDAAIDGSWDMATGTQRWITINDSKAVSNESNWHHNYFGCVWSDEQSASFPDRSADLGLLDVDVELPARISVSYGFVVNGNPRVTSTVTNASEFALPGFWSGAQPQLYLVQDGKVVATASPQSVQRGGMMGILDSPAVMHREGGGTSAAIAPAVDGALSPGDSLSGEFLWRDVAGCNTLDGPADVSPGTYTVLAVHSLSISNQQPGIVYGVPEPAIDSGDSSAVAPEMEILPAPVEWDGLDLQAWTSLGTVRVS